MGGKWSLVFFTLLTQTGIGVFFVNRLFTAPTELIRVVDFFAVSLTAVAMLLSFSHLGSPTRFFRALYNLKTSWLSREGLCTGVFFGGQVLLIYAGGNLTVAITQALTWITVAFGWVTAVCVAIIYTRTAIPAWKDSYTHIAFYTATLILGVALYAAVSTGRGLSLPVPLLLVCLGAVAVQIGSLAAYLATIGLKGPAGAASMQLIGDMRPAIVASQLLNLAGCYFLIDGLPGAGGVVAFVALATGQILNRYAFYASGIHVMLNQVE